MALTDGDIAFIFLAFVTVVGGIFIAYSDGAMGDTPTGNDDLLIPDTGYIGNGEPVGSFCRQMNGTLWTFSVYRNPADSTDRTVYGFFSINNGSDWNQIIITQSGDVGYEVNGYPASIIDSVALSNNSIVLGILDVNYWGSSGKVEITFLCHWNNSDLSQWERLNGYSSASYSAAGPGMAVNASDKISYMYKTSSTTYAYAKYFDPEDRSMGFFWNHNIGVTADRKYWVFWNGTNWNYVYSTTYGSTYARCYDEGENIVWQQGLVASNWIDDVVLSSSGIFAMIQADSPTWYGYIIFIDTDLTPSAVYLTSDQFCARSQLGINNICGTWFTAICYYTNTDKFIWFGAHYDDSQAIWQASESDLFDESDDTTDTVVFQPGQLYPYNIDGSGNHTQLPHELGGPNYGFAEYDTGDSNWNYWVELDSTWPGILGWTYTPAPGGGPGGGNATTTETSMGVWWDTGCITSAVIIFVVIVVIAMFYNRT